MELKFQQRLKGETRPTEEELNYEPIFIDSASAVPQIGDYIEFTTEKSGQKGIYKVVSKYFKYSLNGSKYNVLCNIVVERDDAAAPRLIKE